MSKIIPSIIFLIACSVLTGCVAPKPQQPVSHVVRCQIPEISTLPETDYSPVKGGVRITVTPASYDAAWGRNKSHRRLPPPMLYVDKDPQSGPKAFIEETIVPLLKPSPDHMAFTVKINNTLSRVFRGAGTVVQFNVGGKLYSVDQTGYGEMLGAIVPPEGELQFSIHGPKLESMPDSGTIGVFFYDVVTATDVAGNVTEKQNFTWYFKYEAKVVEKTAEVIRKQYVVPVSRLHTLRP